MTRVRLASLALLLLLVPLLLTCSRESPSEDEAPQVVRLLMWKPNQPEVWDEILRTFEERNPDLALEREIGPHSSTAFHDMLTQKLKNASRDLDVFLMDVVWPPEFGAAGWALPLDDVFPENEQAEFFDGAILANTFAGRIYGIPLYVDSGMLYHRTDLLESYDFEPPATWTELVAQAQAIVAGEAAVGRELVGYSAQFKQYEGLVCDMLEFVLGNGGHLVDPATGRSALASEPALGAVRFVREELIGRVAPRGVLTYQEPESLDLFVQGRAVFHRNWPYAWEVSNNPDRSRVAGKVGIASLPHFEGGESRAALGGWQVGISRYSKRQEAAWRLVRFLTSPEILKRLALRAGLAPARKELYDDPEILAAQPQLARMRDVFATAQPRPRTPLYPAVSNVLQRYFSTVLSDPAVDIAARARDADAEIDRLLALANADAQ